MVYLLVAVNKRRSLLKEQVSGIGLPFISYPPGPGMDNGAAWAYSAPAEWVANLSKEQIQRHAISVQQLLDQDCASYILFDNAATTRQIVDKFFKSNGYRKVAEAGRYRDMYVSE